MKRHPALPEVITLVDEPPTESVKRREVISDTVTGVAEGVIGDIAGLRQKLDDLERITLQNAACVTDNLNQFGNICDTVRGETGRVGSVVDGLLKIQIERARELDERQH
jgi:hypothetical protein